MKKIVYVSFILMASLVSFQVNAKGGVTEKELTQEASLIVQQFAGVLKPKLKAAIQSGGLVNAVEVCSIEAPKIAKNLSEETGWDIKRVSLKARNKGSATPDGFETKVLQQFNKRQKSGESPSTLKYSSMTDSQFRFMRAQGTEGLCLGCHGSSITAEVKRVLDAHYPDDMATGYSLGEIRGAFSLTKAL